MSSALPARELHRKTYRLFRQCSQQGILANESGLSETEQLMLRLGRMTESKLLTEMLNHHLSSGGKRLRARLALASVEALGGFRRDAIAWAAAVELLHNASLVHDDIQDGDRMRRGKPTLWVQHGPAQAINSGDTLLMLPFLAIAEIPIDPVVRSQLSTLLARRATNTVSGQVEELEIRSRSDLSFSEYLAMVRRKTGELLALPVEGAALITGRRTEEAYALAEQFIDLGTLFQLQDDILDLYGDKGRDHVGSDLYEGKVSALVLAYLMRHPESSDWLLDILRQDRKRTQVLQVKRMIERFRESGALDYVISYMVRIVERLSLSSTLVNEPELHRVALELAERAMRPIQHVIETRPEVRRYLSSIFERQLTEIIHR